MRTLGLALASAVVAAGGCLAEAEERSAGEDERLVVAGGGRAGVYYRYAGELAAVASARLGVDARVTETGGSVENLRSVADGSAALALTAADAAADAVTGRPPFEEEPLPIRAVARVYDDFVHLVVPADSAIHDIRDLGDRRVSFGAEGSGTEVIARRLLDAAGLDPDGLDNAMLGIDGSIEALRAGEVEAFFWSGGLSTPGLHELAEAEAIRLVPLGDHVDAVSQRHGHGYRHAVVPRGTYGVGWDVPTMAVPNYLVAHADTDADLVHDVLEVLFEQRAEMAARVEAVGLIDRRRAIFTEPVDLHGGALRYYRDVKE